MIIGGWNEGNGSTDGEEGGEGSNGIDWDWIGDVSVVEGEEDEVGEELVEFKLLGLNRITFLKEKD